MPTLIGLDIGTTSIKAVLFETGSGKVIRQASHPTPLHHPKPGWSEHDPDEIWSVVCTCLREISRNETPIGIGISSMAEAGIALDHNDHPLYPMIAWFDQRTDVQTSWVESQVKPLEIHAITGQLINPSFSLLKIKWMQENIPDFNKNFRRWLSMPDYIAWKLTSGETYTDYSVASRTLLFDQKTGDWSPQMLRLANLSCDNFPNIAASGTIIGGISASTRKLTGLRKDLAVVLGGHDHLCAAFACGGVKPGSVIDSSGSSSSLLFLTGQFISNLDIVQRGFACYRYLIPGSFLFKAGLKTSGTAVNWLAQLTSLKGSQDFTTRIAQLETEAVINCGKTAGPLWMPHFLGSGTPQGDRFSMAAVAGLSIQHTPADLFRGLLESLAFWAKDNLNFLCAFLNQDVDQMILTGGLNQSDLLCQLKASILNLPVIRPDIPESAAVGAALLAGIATGCYPDYESAPAKIEFTPQTFYPEPSWVNFYKSVYDSAYLPLYSSLQPIHHSLNRLNHNL